MPDASCSLPALIRTVEERAGEDEPLERLQVATDLAGELGDIAEQLLDHFVGEARQRGSSWAQIGDRFGVSKQAAQQRFVSDRRGGPFRHFGEAQSVIAKAQEEARELGHNRVGTEHLLLGVLAQTGRPAVEAIGALGVTADAARAQVADALPRGESAAPVLRFMPRAKRVLGMSIGGARWMGHEDVLPEHVLLAILRDRESGGAQVVAELAGPREVRTKVLEALFPDGVPEWIAQQGPSPWAHGHRRGRGPRRC
jgi:Clp amino terminal domain, pathogenicity island component